MRNNLIDFTRGFAFILMLIHHFNYFNPNLTKVSKNVETLGIISRTLFIVLVGISMKLFEKKNKNKNKKNGFKKCYLILLAALIVTLTTYLLLPNNKIIFFGVLHFIGTITLIMQNMSLNLIILLGIISLIISKHITKLNSSDNLIYLIMGTYSKTRSPLDIFQI